MKELLNRYADLAPPQPAPASPARPVLCVQESPLAAFRTIYAEWLEDTDRKNALNNLSPEQREERYRDAEIRLRQKPALQTISAADAHRMLTEIQPDQGAAVGLFFSALFNFIDLPELSKVFSHAIMGYRLAAGKRLVVCRDSNVEHLGIYAEGDILNFGKVGCFAYYAHNGLQANCGEVRWDMAWAADGGIQVNFQKVFEKIGMETNGGIQINVGEVKQMGGHSRSLPVSVCNGTWEVADSANSGVQLRFRQTMNFNSNQFDLPRNNPAQASLPTLLTALRVRLEALTFLLRLRDRPEKALWYLRRFAWPAFTAEIRQEIKALHAALGKHDQHIAGRRTEGRGPRANTFENENDNKKGKKHEPGNYWLTAGREKKHFPDFNRNGCGTGAESRSDPLCHCLCAGPKSGSIA